MLGSGGAELTGRPPILGLIYYIKQMDEGNFLESIAAFRGRQRAVVHPDLFSRAEVRTLSRTGRKGHFCLAAPRQTLNFDDFTIFIVFIKLCVILYALDNIYPVT